MTNFDVFTVSIAPVVDGDVMFLGANSTSSYIATKSPRMKVVDVVVGATDIG